MSDGAIAQLQHNSRYSLEFDVGLDETSPTDELSSRAEHQPRLASVVHKGERP